MTDHVIVEDDGAIRLLRLNRPAKMNALSDAMYEALAEALENAAVSKTIHCIIIAGGPTGFSAGADMEDLLYAAQHREGLRPQVLRFLHRIAHAGKPLVAAVQGVAVGIGTTLLLHCDYVVAAANARFSTPFVNLGITPEAASSLLMPRQMGIRRAFEFLVMGRPFDAQTAKAIGLVNTVVPVEDLEAETMKVALEIAALPVEAVAASRRLIRGSLAQVVKRIDEEAEILRVRLRSDEARTAFEAFFARNRKTPKPP
jgi:enoyl-CoA hydratase/carnithine racemase